jgi:hypothetical protein
MENLEPRTYYNQKCYAIKNCMHCPDCLAFALKYYREVPDDPATNKRSSMNKKNLVTKFLLMTISSESLSCTNALSSRELKDYINRLLEQNDELPICHYEFSN